jgi:hypothetical protein
VPSENINTFLGIGCLDSSNLVGGIRLEMLQRLVQIDEHLINRLLPLSPLMSVLGRFGGREVRQRSYNTALFAGRNDLHLHEDFRLDQLSNDLEHERRSNIAQYLASHSRIRRNVLSVGQRGCDLH